MPELYLILQIAGAMLSLDLIILLFFRWDCMERKVLIVLFGDIFIFNVINVLSYMMPEGWIFTLGIYVYTALEAIFIIGITMIIISMSEYPLPRRLLIVESLYFAVLYVLLLTNYRHHLFFRTQTIEEINGRQIVMETPGIFKYMFRFGFLFVVLALFVFALVVYVKRQKEVQKGKRVKMKLLVIGTVIPLFGSILYVTGAMEESAAASLSMLAEGIIVMFSLNKYHFLDVIQSARDLVVDTMRLALIIVDEEFYYLDSNQYAKTIYPDLGELEEGCWLPGQMPDLYELFQGKQENGLSLGERQYECQVSEVYHQGRMRGYALCIYDVTEQQKYMEQLKMLRQKAEQENEEKSLFLANASHEIRTPMNVILGMSEINLHKNTDPEMEYVLKSIYSAGKGLMNLINGILDFSKIEAGKMELQEAPYALEKILMDMANMVYTKLYQQPVKFSLEILGKVPVQLLGDSSKIRIILTNLLGNAMKYTEEGSICLQVEGREETEEEVSLVFRVKDTGTGMHQEEADHIFENYTQVGTYTEAREKGTGLGLAITKRMVELMEGTIGVESQIGKGTVFTVNVRQKPLGSQRLSEGRISREDVKHYLQNEMIVEQVNAAYPGMKVLVVDDMETNAVITAGTLKLYQIDSDIAGSAQEAFQKMEEKSYDMLLIDQIMPGMDGVTMVKQIQRKQDWDQVPMIALTANRGRKNEMLLKDSGFDEVLEKPIDKGKLEQILEIYLGQRRAKRAEVYSAYFRELDHIGGRLEQQLWENPENFVIHVHGIKGASRNIGMSQLGNFAEQMESDGREGRWEEVQKNLPEFLELLEETKEKIKKEIQNAPWTGRKSTGKKGSLEPEILRELSEAFENFDLEQAEQIMQKLWEYEYDPKEQKLLESLQEDMENLDYELAVEKIRAFA